MKLKTSIFTAAIAAALAATAVQAQDNVVKLGATRYTTHSSSNGLTATPPVFPAGADAETGDATTLLLVIERSLTPNLGIELALGVPPRIKAKGTGAAAALGDELLSTKNVSPTLLLNYYFGDPANALRPYVGAGINYTKFTAIRSSLPTSKLDMSDSWGWALQAGLSYAVRKDWGLFASVARLDVKSDVDAIATIPGVPVPVEVRTTIDLKPITYSLGLWYRF
ncbi:MAG TPA: OmpW family outer membrane protein [Caldimonas sp.]